jgi:hypothetical protein
MRFSLSVEGCQGSCLYTNASAIRVDAAGLDKRKKPFRMTSPVYDFLYGFFGPRGALGQCHDRQINRIACFQGHA